jgi:hypothetical protein
VAIRETTRRLARAGAAAGAVIGLLSLAAPAGAAAHGAAPPAGVPRYYVEQSIATGAAVVRATSSGAVTGKLACPRGERTLQTFAAADHQTFFLACRAVSGTTAILRVQLTAAGRAGAYSAVPGARITQPIGRLAVSASGAELAVSVFPGDSAARGEIVVINTRTGKRAVWRDGPAGPGMVRLGIADLSLTASGQELMVYGVPRCLRGQAGHVCRANGGEGRVVSPAAKGGSLSTSRLVLRQAALTSLSQGYINDAVLTANGRSILAAVVFGAAPGSSVSVVQASAATGRRQRVLYRLGTGSGFEYAFVTPDPSSRWLLFDAGPTTGTVNGWIDHGRLVRLRPAGDEVGYGAWSGQ